MAGPATTIAGVATPAGVGGIGIVKISGDIAFDVACALFRYGKFHRPIQQVGISRPCRDDLVKRRLSHGFLVDPEGGSVLDEVILIAMPAPHSYTGEDVIEIQAHGGPVILSQIFQNVLRSGCVLAEPGEFTRRAFMNGKIDLVQAEAVLELINARHKSAAGIAMRHLQGGLGAAIEPLREAIKQWRASLEGSLDFPGEVSLESEVGSLCAIARKKWVPTLRELLQRHEDARPFRDGTRIVIAGKPNVGKSSLLNRMLFAERAIVTPVPGTTRDMLEADAMILGLPVTLVDTAGVQKTQEAVETLGIQRTMEQVALADLILFVVDASRPIEVEDQDVFQNVEGKSFFLVMNKSDLAAHESSRVFSEQFSKKATATLRVSCKDGTGIEDLRKSIQGALLSGVKGNGEKLGIAPNLRQAILLERILDALERIANGCDTDRHEIELIGYDLRDAAVCLDELVGKAGDQDILDRVFSNFCIGK